MQSTKQLSDKISCTSKQQEAVIQEFLNKIDLEPLHIEILDYLHQHPRIIQKKLTEHFGKALTHPLMTLENKALICRKASIFDIRQKRVLLTEEGEAVLKEIQQRYDRIEQQVQRSLTLAERTTLFELLDKVQKGLGC